MSKQLSNTPPDSADVKYVAMTEILADWATNSRKFRPEPKYIQNLSRDIIARGQLNPMLVLERNGDAPNNGCPYALVAGFCRYDAIQLANESGENIQAFIRVMPNMDAVEAYEMSIAENNPNLRREPTAMDMAYQIRELQEKGMVLKDISKIIGKSIGWVSDTGKFTTLRPQIQKQIHLGEIPWNVAQTLPTLTEEEQDAMLARIKAAKETGESATAIAQTSRKRKTKKAKGRGSEEGDGSGKKAPSIKVALNAYEALAKEPEPDPETGKAPKETKAEETFRLIFGVILKFQAGRIGQQAMANQIKKLL